MQTSKINWTRQTRARRLGQIGLLMTMLLLAACAGLNQKPQPVNNQSTQSYKKYTAVQLEAIIRDEVSCGSAAKQALYDWSVGL